jgi:hypothetical protein
MVWTSMDGLSTINCWLLNISPTMYETASNNQSFKSELPPLCTKHAEKDHPHTRVNLSLQQLREHGRLADIPIDVRVPTR